MITVLNERDSMNFEDMSLVLYKNQYLLAHTGKQ